MVFAVSLQAVVILFQVSFGVSFCCFENASFLSNSVEYNFRIFGSLSLSMLYVTVLASDVSFDTSIALRLL